MKNTLAISNSAATKIFLSIAASELSACEKGCLMSIASRMMENPELVKKDDFSSFPGGEDIFEAIALAISRSRRARAAAAARKKANEISVDVANTEPTIVRRIAERPRRHPRLKVKCRYKSYSRSSTQGSYHKIRSRSLP